MVLIESEKIELGSAAYNFKLKGTDDNDHSLDDYKGAKALVIVFMCNHCPYVQAQWDKLVALQDKYKGSGVKFVGINPNYNPDYPEDSFEKMKEYYEKYGMNFDYLQDPTQEVAKKYKAQCTPDIFVYDENMRLAYHGRVDDARSPGENPATNELDDALELLIKGKQPDSIQYPSMGCSIKWM